MRKVCKLVRTKGQDRVARKAMINNFENRGLNVLDFETMVKSLRLLSVAEEALY